MKEHPILFSGPMVRAILAGNKTVTRRPLAPQPDRCIARPQPGLYYQKPCPFGVPGDVLWVREAAYIAPPDFGPAPGLTPDEAGRWRAVDYSATMDADAVRCARDYGVKLTPSVHMPRWACRLTLRVTGVRVERLQAITEQDAREEGITDGGCLNCGEHEPCGCEDPRPDARDTFIRTWDRLYAKRGLGWHVDPWLWVVSFEREVGQ